MNPLPVCLAVPEQPGRPVWQRALSASLLALALTACGGQKPEALIASARGYMEKQDYRAAAIELRSALQQAPDNGEARLLFGLALLESGDAFGAERELRRAQQLGAGNERVAPALVRALVAQGKGDVALREMSQVPVANPVARAVLLAALGDAHAGLGQLEEAGKRYRDARAADPSSVSARLGEIRLTALSGDRKGALQQVKEAVRTAPGYESHLLAGDLAAAEGDYEAAIDAYRAAAADSPAQAGARFSLISLLIQRNRLDEAAALVDKALKAKDSGADIRYLQALLAVGRKDYPGARDAVQQVLKGAPEHVPSLLLAGMVESLLAAPQQAESFFKKALNLAPQLPAARRALATLRLENGDATGALEALQPALQQRPDDPDLLALAGSIHLARGELEKSAVQYEKAVAKDPGNAQRRAALAATRLQAGEVERAIRDLEAAAAQDGQQHLADVMLATTLLRKGDAERALGAITRLEGKQPDNPLALNLKGIALLARKDQAKARAAFERALELQPAFFPAAQNLAQLDLAARRPELAKRRFEAVLKADPRQPQALEALAALAAGQGGASEQVLPLLEKAVSGNPHLVSPRIALVNYLIAQGDARRALAAAQEAQGGLGESAEVMELLGSAQLAAGEANQALATFSKLAVTRSDSPGVLLRLAQAQVATRDRSGAQETLRRALALRRDMPEVHAALVRLELLQGRHQEAIKLARGAQQSLPGAAIGHELEGEVLLATGQVPEAVAAYQSAHQKGRNADTLVRLHGVLIKAGRGVQADQLAAEWLKSRPGDDQFRLYVADVALRQQRYDVAVAHYRQVLERMPNNAAVLNNLAWAARGLKDGKALEYAEAAVRIAPRQAAYLDTLGSMLLERGERDRALKLLRQAAEIAPQSPDIRLNLARALLQSGKGGEARKELEQLSRLGDQYPGQREVKDLLREL